VKAAVFDRPGPAHEVLQVRDVPTPTPGHGEVLVRMIASPVNPSDVAFATGRYGLQPTYPATPGFEGVGVVEASGGGLLGWYLRGKRVVVVNSRTGNWAEYCVAAARQCFPVASDIPDKQAATFFVNPATAIAITRHVFRVPPGGWLLQTAAGSALGKMVIRLGSHYGFRTINVVRRQDQVEELKRLGANEVLTESEFTEDRVKAITQGAGVPFVMDPVGGPTGTQRLIRAIRRHMRAGFTTSEISATFSLDCVTDAVRASEAPGKSGKVLLTLSPNP
jgi:NADPH:quinone reductase